MGARGRAESLSDSEDVSFVEDSVGICGSASQLSVGVVGNGTSLDVLLLKGGRNSWMLEFEIHSNDEVCLV